MKNLPPGAPRLKKKVIAGHIDTNETAGHSPPGHAKGRRVVDDSIWI